MQLSWSSSFDGWTSLRRALGILIIALCFWTPRCPIGGRKIDPPEVLIFPAKLNAYLMEAIGSELDVDHRTRNLVIGIRIFETQGLGYRHYYLQSDEAPTRIYDQRGGMFDESRSVRVPTGYKQRNRKQNSLAASLIRERHGAGAAYGHNSSLLSRVDV